jgi:hypothetical protein
MIFILTNVLLSVGAPTFVPLLSRGINNKNAFDGTWQMACDP